MPLHNEDSISVGQTSEACRIDIMGLRLHNLHRSVIAGRVIAAVNSGQKMLVVNANANLVVLSQTIGWMSALFSKADIAFCDGAGVQLAIRLLKGRAAHRTTPPEWIGGVLEALGPKASIFWLGGSSEAVMKAARNYERRYGVRTAGVQHGFFDMAKDSVENLALVERINRAAPSILLVNMGMPRQERWLWDNWDRLQTGVAITGGALVDHAAGRVHRPPRWVANLGIEWLVRLVREPKRLWRRYLLGLPVFGLYVLRYALSGNKHKRA
ncbi:MAG TPA: WecB/TagA/CpsF family glycosyltransferase [Acidocella sp.]|jgi:N-acetylglucosaminyldiphosphoundecaprenol N-acetyl-beta-D-mannosaminyltransferase|nr:WecB/TagA/CpsF family glycosyltransferase [Acidocella sp.]